MAREAITRWHTRLRPSTVFGGSLHRIVVLPKRQRAAAECCMLRRRGAGAHWCSHRPKTTGRLTDPKHIVSSVRIQGSGSQPLQAISQIEQGKVVCVFADQISGFSRLGAARIFDLPPMAGPDMMYGQVHANEQSVGSASATTCRTGIPKASLLAGLKTSLSARTGYPGNSRHS